MGLLDGLLGKKPPGGGLDARAGGAPGLTTRMRNMYQDYNLSTIATGENALPWAEWLQSQGYALGRDLQVRPLQQ